MSAGDALEDLKLLAAGAARARGDALFPLLAQYVATALGASRALITELVADDAVQTLGVWESDASVPNYTYEIAGTPCSAVIAGDTLHVAADLGAHYARATPGFVGYFGRPLIADDGSVAGHLCAFSSSGLAVSERQRLLCDVLAGRAAAELQRLRSDRREARLRAHNRYLRRELRALHNSEEIIGASPALLAVLDEARRVAPSDSAVLVTGEPGTGKELMARAIHATSRRADRPFIKLDCAAPSSGLVERELFGYEHGAFPDALRKREGRFELANYGTLYLHEVGGLGTDTQGKLLRALRERTFERLGSEHSLRFDVRVIATTNRDLRKAVRAGDFDEQLFAWLSASSIVVPALRDRVGDIPLLAQFFVQKHAARVDRRVTGVDTATLANLERYPWPGNVRELEQLVERALVADTSPQLRIAHEWLAPAASAAQAPRSPGAVDDASSTGLHFVQRTHILRVLESTHWVIEGSAGAAVKLGLKPATLRHRMKKLGIARIRAARQGG